jgi:hypothetical protein
LIALDKSFGYAAGGLIHRPVVVSRGYD